MYQDVFIFVGQKLCEGRWAITNIALQNGHEIENKEKLLVLKLYSLIKLK